MPSGTRGSPYGLFARGPGTLWDVARIEAGTDPQRSGTLPRPISVWPRTRSRPPMKWGLGRLVHLDRGPFVGTRGLGRGAKKKAPRKCWWGLETGTGTIRKRPMKKFGLPAAVSAESWKGAPGPSDAPGGRWAKITSAAWSPILKKSLALALVDPGLSAPGSVCACGTTQLNTGATGSKGRCGQPSLLQSGKERRPHERYL